MIYYVNLCNVVGIVFVWNDQILLCKCVIELCYGFWILFVGFMEIGEIIVQVVNCEIQEEVGVNVEIGELYLVFNVLYVY